MSPFGGWVGRMERSWVAGESAQVNGLRGVGAGAIERRHRCVDLRDVVGEEVRARIAAIGGMTEDDHRAVDAAEHGASAISTIYHRRDVTYVGVMLLENVTGISDRVWIGGAHSDRHHPAALCGGVELAIVGIEVARPGVDFGAERPTSKVGRLTSPRCREQLAQCPGVGRGRVSHHNLAIDAHPLPSD